MLRLVSPEQYDSIISLLFQHVPHSLPTLSTLLTSSSTSSPPLTTYLTTFNDTFETNIILVDYGNQSRFFSTDESKYERLNEREREIAQERVQKAFREYLRDHHDGRQVLRIGAIPDVWCKSIEIVTKTIPISASRIWFPPSILSISSRLATIDRRVRVESDAAGHVELNGTGEGLPRGFQFREAIPSDVEIILSTSEVPHDPSYFLTRLSQTSCIVTTTISNSTPSSTPTPSSPSEQSKLDERLEEETLIAHCTTHRDGSIGTLYVNPNYRRLGIASNVLRHRFFRMNQPSRSPDEVSKEGRIEGGGVGGKIDMIERGFCYVHRENEKSRKVMNRMGLIESEWNVSWAIVEMKKLR